MPVTFCLPDAGVTDLVAAVLERWNAEAHDAGVRVAVLFATHPDGEPALKHGGYPAAALVSVVPLVTRMFVSHDALVRIDLQAWGELTDAGREALLAHECLHLEVQRPPDSEHRHPGAPWWKADDIGRPVLKLVNADWNGGDGWAAVVARYGEACLETKNWRKVRSIVEPALKGEVN